MQFPVKFLSAFASLALAQAASAQQPNQQLHPAHTTAAVVLCRGGANVPMTADPQQALPMNVVADLACGQAVSLVAGNEGYTVNVRTADGKSGFVPWMNVGKGQSINAKHLPLQPAVIHDGVAKWVAGTEGSERFFTEGTLVESLTINGVTVQVSLQDSGWKLRANIAVANGSLLGVEVIPSHIALNDVQQARKALVYQEPKKLRGAVNHQILWTEATAAPSQSGYLVDAGYSDRDRQPVTQNYLADHQAAVQSVSERRTEFNPHSQMKNVALRETIVLPNQQLAGSSWFDRDSKLSDVVVRIPVGSLTYEFPFSFSHEK
ncbi:MAG TPA: hypothetical protein VIM00_10390 [Candidatus Acidoferrum sp.]|jgi:hypothetical protein